MKFKAGDRVMLSKDSHHFGEPHQLSDGEVGVVIVPHDGGNNHPVHVRYGGGTKSYEESDLILEGERRATKFIAIYDEGDGDPAREFSSEKELMEWLNDLPSEVIKSSIRVFSVSGEYEPKFCTTLEKVAGKTTTLPGLKKRGRPVGSKKKGSKPNSEQVWFRINRLGWSEEEARTTPVKHYRRRAR
jgi:hypothetical protein